MGVYDYEDDVTVPTLSLVSDYVEDVMGADDVRYVDDVRSVDDAPAVAGMAGRQGGDMISRAMELISSMTPVDMVTMLGEPNPEAPVVGGGVRTWKMPRGANAVSAIANDVSADGEGEWVSAEPWTGTTILEDELPAKAVDPDKGTREELEGLLANAAEIEVEVFDAVDDVADGVTDGVTGGAHDGRAEMPVDQMPMFHAIRRFVEGGSEEGESEGPREKEGTALVEAEENKMEESGGADGPDCRVGGCGVPGKGDKLAKLPMEVNSTLVENFAVSSVPAVVHNLTAGLDAAASGNAAVPENELQA
eukprot:evm.model.scf_69EXC.3 EVM.evm.TU.scf_69EXC.3   scf_69EXC:90217-93045(+)